MAKFVCLLIAISLMSLPVSSKETDSKCKYRRLQNSDYFNTGNYKGDAGIVIGGILKVGDEKKFIVIDSEDFVSVFVKSSHTDEDIIEKLKTFKTKGLSLEKLTFNSLVGNTIFIKSEDKEIAKKIIIQSLLKNLKGYGDSYIIGNTIKDTLSIVSEFINQNILIETGGYVGSLRVRCISEKRKK